MSTEQLNQNIQGKENPQDIWIKPNYFNELGEIKRTAKTFAKDDNELYTKILTNFEKQLPLAELEPLTDEIWAKLENTDSIIIYKSIVLKNLLNCLNCIIVNGKINFKI